MHACLHIPFHVLRSLGTLQINLCLQIYFDAGCLRTPASFCLNSSNTYYPMTNYGLNLLTYYFLDQANLLVLDAAADATASNSRFAFIWSVSSAQPRVAYCRCHNTCDLVGCWCLACRFVFGHSASLLHYQGLRSEPIKTVTVLTHLCRQCTAFGHA